MAAALGKYHQAIAALMLFGLSVLAPARAGDLAVQNCTWCHGTSAQGYTPAPRLAGQRAPYLRNQLIRLRAHDRNSPLSKQYMWAAAQNLGDARIRDLADYFSKLAPRPAADGNEAAVARGRAIYQNGLPDENIVACVACHGPNAQGVGAIPRIGGLAYTYLQRRLKQWGEGYNRVGATPMPHIAGQLSPDKIDALASYLSFVRYADRSGR